MRKYITKCLQKKKRGEQEIPEGYADGGFVEDYYDGVQGGQSDKKTGKSSAKILYC